jgi:hypothetical protein
VGYRWAITCYKTAAGDEGEMVTPRHVHAAVGPWHTGAREQLIKGKKKKASYFSDKNNYFLKLCVLTHASSFRR